jgi:hypothetical protein
MQPAWFNNRQIGRKAVETKRYRFCGYIVVTWGMNCGKVSWGMLPMTVGVLGALK